MKNINSKLDGLQQNEYTEDNMLAYFKLLKPKDGEKTFKAIRKRSIQ